MLRKALSRTTRGGKAARCIAASLSQPSRGLWRRGEQSRAPTAATGRGPSKDTPLPACLPACPGSAQPVPLQRQAPAKGHILRQGSLPKGRWLGWAEEGGDARVTLGGTGTGWPKSQEGFWCCGGGGGGEEERGHNQKKEDKKGRTTKCRTEKENNKMLDNKM